MRALRFCSSLLFVLVASFGFVACSKKPAPAPPPAPAPVAAPAPAALSVASVTLGRAVDADGRVAAPTTTFAASDTIYASVATTGASAGFKLTARWTFDGNQPIKEDSLDLQSAGSRVTEFHISRPSGWPAGSYQVEILLNGAVAASQAFTVQ